MGRIVEALRAGTFRDMAGVEHTYTEKDLASIAASYNPSLHEAPVVIGHPALNAPAFGWIKRAFAEGKKLMLELGELVPEFEQAWKKGMYKKRSIALNPDNTIRHIGFLGAVPPGVKGLADYAFADNGAAVIEYAETDVAYALRQAGSMFGTLRDFIIEKYDMETADRVLAPWAIDLLKTIESEPRHIQSFAEGDSMELQDQVHALTKQVGDLSKKNSDLEGQVAAFAEQVKAKDVEIDALKTKEKNMRDADVKKDLGAFCDELVAGGKLKPADRPVVLQQLEILHAASQGTFAEGTVTPVDAYKRQLHNAPQVISFAEIATQQGAAVAAGKTAGDKLVDLANKKISGDKTISFGDAFKAVQIEFPELAAEYAVEINGSRA
jgi:hypothetical protein